MLTEKVKKKKKKKKKKTHMFSKDQTRLAGLFSPV